MDKEIRIPRVNEGKVLCFLTNTRIVLLLVAHGLVARLSLSLKRRKRSIRSSSSELQAWPQYRRPFQSPSMRSTLQTDRRQGGGPLAATDPTHSMHISKGTWMKVSYQEGRLGQFVNEALLYPSCTKSFSDSKSRPPL